MSTTDAPTFDWKDESDIKQEHFADGYQQDARRHARNPTERDDGSSTDELEHNHMEGTASATTMYADRRGEGYDPYESLPECERYDTKAKKFTRLWKINAGRDEHTASGKTYADDELNKVDWRARDRRRFVQAVASTFDLDGPALERAADLASRDDPRRYNYYGGMDTFILAVVAAVAFEFGVDINGASHDDDLAVDLREFHELRRDWGVDLDDLIAATRKVLEER